MSKTETARDQAVAQMASVAAMVAALECDYDRLEELREERADSSYASRVLAERQANGAHLAPNELGWWEDHFAAEAEELADLEDAAGDCEDRDDAERRISEDALSVEVRSDWGTPGEPMTASEFRIVLCTGGPHVELVGDLDDDGTPSRVRCLFKDWGEGGELHDFDHDAALTYCGQFFFGE